MEQPSTPAPSSPSAPSPQGAARPARPFDERLTAPRSWWLIAVLAGLSGGLILLPVGAVAMLVGLVVTGAAAAVGVSAYGSARVRVVAGSLVAGDARIPVAALGEARALDADEAQAWRTYKADPRAHMLLRGYVRTAVRVEVTDPEDPTPYVYVSTRRPEALVAALEAAGEAAPEG
ncbi:DUF3093 domain-containing protein [Streptomyces sp. DSM 42041]|uniref:DUF3093 domain-containing protein n=1 Tax=Streptomyces hazeniae TaxID=3075538 RepID=A0ABU2NRV3_9ACTN|nr:DUF3093 domain-containing protein [Streptomyces sp. DSM 42041]MDT0378363.1 DUF3093 domain-containing protein [Streptomyces sp. DSM 42041]